MSGKVQPGLNVDYDAANFITQLVRGAFKSTTDELYRNRDNCPVITSYVSIEQSLAILVLVKCNAT